MDNVVGRLIYRITGDSGTLRADLKRCDADLARIAGEFDRLASSVRSFTTKVVTGALIRQLTQAASDLEELDAKFDTVFSGIEDETRSWAEEYAAAVNRGRISTMEFMATIQDIQTGYGMATEEAAAFSKAVVGITNDLASFSNIPFNEALAAMQSGLAQQFEALRRLGVGISVEIINQSEYAEALGKTWLEMSNLERQQAILDEIVKQSPNALHQTIDSWQEYDWRLGDAARTSESYANTLQGFTGTLRDFSAELGNYLLPSLTTVLGMGTELMRMFAGLPEPVKATTTSILAAGAAFTALGGGPVGAAIAGVSALTVLVSGLPDDMDRLERQTKDLSAATGSYGEAVRMLSSDTGNLTKEQEALYEAQAKLARSDALDALLDLSDTYGDNMENLAAQQRMLDSYRGQLDAYTLIADGDLKAIGEALMSIPEEAGEAYRLAFENVISSFEVGSDAASEEVVRLAGMVADMESTVLGTEGAVESLVRQIAMSLNTGLLKEGDLLLLTQDLRQEVLDAAEAMGTEADGADDAAASMDGAASASREWRDALRELKAEMAEDDEDWESAHSLRQQMLTDEHRAALKDLAGEYSQLFEDMDIASLTTTQIRQVLKESEEAAQELAALDEYFALQRVQIWKEMDDAIEEEAEKTAKKRKEYSEDLQDDLDDLRSSLRRDTADELISSGSIEEGFAIRRRLLEEEYQAEIDDWRRRLEAQEAGEEDRALIEERYRIRRAELDREETEERIAQWNEAAEAERQALEDAADAQEEHRREQLQRWREFFGQLRSTITSISSYMVQISGYATDRRIAQIEAEEQALLASLGLQEESERDRLERELEEAQAKGDAETAQEKARALERLRIEEETDERIARLEREQAEREKRNAVFKATLDTLASVVGFMVDPGGWAGIAMSAMAAATGAAQIAAIQAEPLPSYDVGAVDIDEDHIARVHQGEMVVPKSFAQGIRDGDLSLGGGSVEIQIHNYTGAEVRTEESGDVDTRRIRITIGRIVEGQIADGRYDGALSTRYGLRRAGMNG